MCNLYSLTKGQAAIVPMARAIRDTAGNLPPLPGIFPDYPAPIVRNAADGVRELALVRWGMPSSRRSIFEKARIRASKLEAKGKPVDFGELLRMEPDSGTTNVRNTASSHWKRWLVESRCLGRVDEPDPDTDCGELHEAEEAGRELVVAGRDAA